MAPAAAVGLAVPIALAVTCSGVSALAFFRVAHGDRAGNIWLGRYDIAGTMSSVYDVVSRAGEWLGPVTFPRELRILDITDSRVLGVERDDFDVEAVVPYALEKR